MHAGRSLNSSVGRFPASSERWTWNSTVRNKFKNSSFLPLQSLACKSKVAGSTSIYTYYQYTDIINLYLEKKKQKHNHR